MASPTFISYTYSWLRDGSFIAHAMDQVGHPESARAYFRWVNCTLMKHAYKVDEIERGMAGLRPDLYQRMLAEIKEQAQLADGLGYDSISFTEHHFHIEGFELSNNPVMLDLFVALNTRRIRVGQLGLVLPAQNPLRVAEDIAMLDHMSGGRLLFGIGPGGLPSDTELFGDVEPKERGRRMIEAVETIQRIWAAEPPYGIPGPTWPVRRWNRSARRRS